MQERRASLIARYPLRRRLSSAAEATETASVLRFPRSFTSAICRLSRGLIARTIALVTATCPPPRDKPGRMELPSPTATTLFIASTLSNSITALGTLPASASHSVTIRRNADCRLPRACIQLGGVCRERNRIKRGTPFYDPEPGVTLGIPKSVVE